MVISVALYEILNCASVTSSILFHMPGSNIVYVGDPWSILSNSSWNYKLLMTVLFR